MSRLLLIALALLIAVGLLLGGGALLRPTAPPDPLADFRALWPADGSGAEPAAGQVAAMPRYSLTVRIDPAARAYSGTLDLTLPVSATAPLRDLYFRLYPNLPHYGGDLRVTGARVDGKNVPYSYDAQDTAVHLALPAPLAHGATAQVWLKFTGKAPQRDPGAYTPFGLSEDVLNLTSFYPILAARRGSSWALDVASRWGDAGFHDAALYRVTVIAPADQVLATGGIEIARSVAADGWATTRYALGPAREVALLLSPRFEVAETDAYGTRVRAYFRPEDAAAGRAALNHAATALQVYSDQFGPYPYRELAVVEAPLASYGLELPGLSLIGSGLFGTQLDRLETTVAHEVAHQWWYNQVGSDQLTSPWLDEGLAEFSVYIYMLARYGYPAAEELRAERWDAPLAKVRAQDAALPIGRPVAGYNPQQYDAIIYAKGALFFAALRAELGERAFGRLLRTYLVRFRWRTATPADFQALAEEVAGRDLRPLFVKWVGAGQ